MTDDQTDIVKVAILVAGAVAMGFAANLINFTPARADVSSQHDVAPSAIERPTGASTRRWGAGHSATLSCLPASIRAALDRANAACGIKVISTYRPGARIAGTGHVSMHASCRAADFTAGAPACVLRALSGWNGKLSTDYGRARHYHIDDGRYARFAHGGSRRYARNGKHRRYARLRHHRREATAQ